MKRPPTFSVIIPTFNRADFIGQTIISVLDQRFSDFEAIVIDDGSTDNTEEVVRSIDDPRLSYFQKENEERAAARNAGTSKASGQYVTFLDSDDIWYDSHLSTALEVAERYRLPEFFHVGYEFRDQNGRTFKPVDYLQNIANDRLIEGNHLSCQGVFVRQDIARQHPFNPDRSLSGTEDYELWLRLASRYPLYCDNRVTSAIVQHDARSVLNMDRQKLEKRIELLEKYLFEDADFQKRFGAQKPAFQANNRVYIALHLALSKQNRFGAVEYLLRALACSPRALKNRAFYGTLKRLVV